jgi:hypothetical protein
MLFSTSSLLCFSPVLGRITAAFSPSILLYRLCWTSSVRLNVKANNYTRMIDLAIVVRIHVFRHPGDHTATDCFPNATGNHDTSEHHRRHQPATRENEPKTKIGLVESINRWSLLSYLRNVIWPFVSLLERPSCFVALVSSCDFAKRILRLFCS